MGATVKSQQGKTALILGVGYSARAVISHLQARGYKVYGTTRDAISAIEMRKDGVIPIIFDTRVSRELLRAVAKANIILSSIPPGKDGDPVLDAISNIGAIARKCSWAGYLSATSVYGDKGGHWAFEDELLYPSTDRGHSRADAEIDWLESGLPVHVFRLAGIYGPGRSPFEKIRNGGAQAVIKPGHVVNRIHLDDIASAIMASIDKPDPVIIYNLADDEPAPPQDVLDFAAALINEPKPPHVNLDIAEMSKMARSFYQDNKRVSNIRAKTMLGWTPKYKDYRVGLTAVLDAERRRQ